MIALLLSTAFAASTVAPADFPLQVAVDCPAAALCRIEVPASFVADNPVGWLLLDEAGAPVPYAVIASDAAPTRWFPSRPRPTLNPAVLDLDLPPEGSPLTVTIQVRSGLFQALARAETRSSLDGPWRPGPWGVVAGGPVMNELSLPVPDPAAVALRLVFDRPWTRTSRDLRVGVGVQPENSLPPATVAVEVGPRGFGGEGVSVYPLLLPGRLRLSSLSLDVDGDVFDRPVSVLSWEVEDDRLVPSVAAERRLTRVALGVPEPEVIHWDGLDIASERLALRVSDGMNPPLDLKQVQLSVTRRVLLVRPTDSAAARYVLYGGEENKGARYDLQLAVAALARDEAAPATVGPIRLNPQWHAIDPVAVAPGAAVDPSRFRFSRPVSGRGPARLPLPTAVLAKLRPGAPDLRLVNANDRQIPFILETDAQEQPVEGVIITREDGATFSQIQLHLPDPELTVSTLRLQSEARSFRRTVSVFALDGPRKRLIASRTWESTGDPPHDLDLSINDAVGADLVIQVEHGDSAPIPIADPRITTRGVALRAVLPEGELRLLYGDRAALERSKKRGLTRKLSDPAAIEPLTAPRFDRAALLPALRGLPVAPAALGEEAALGPPPTSASDQRLALAGLAALAVGVGLLLRRLIRHLPAAEP